MAAWPEERLSTWHDFSEWFARHSEWMRAGGMMICRGQADARWGLRPSLGRVFSEQNISREDALFREAHALWSFQEQAHLHFSKTPAIADGLLSWWGLMQHHRAPTRTLDWTASRYVALYFAVEDLFGCDGAVWVLDAQGLRFHVALLFDGWTFPTSSAELEGMLNEPPAMCRVFDFALAAR